MNEETLKLMEKYDVSFETLEKNSVYIDLDITGCRNDIVALIQETDLSYEDSDEDNMSGKDLISIGGSVISVIQFLGSLEQNHGSYCIVGITIAATASVIFMSIPEARNYIIKLFKKDKDNSEDSIA